MKIRTPQENALRAASILRSTKIPQGSSALLILKRIGPEHLRFDDELFIANACCMGVLSYECEVPITRIRENMHGSTKFHVKFEDSEHYSGYFLENKIGLNYRGRVNENIDHSELVKYVQSISSNDSDGIDVEFLNDVHKLSFDQIATIWTTFPDHYFRHTYE